MRPRDGDDGGTYERRAYDPSSGDAPHHRAGSTRTDSNRGRDHMNDDSRPDQGRHYGSHDRYHYNSPHDRFHPHTHSHMHSASVHSHHASASSTAGPPTAPGSSDQSPLNPSPLNPTPYPYDRATPPQPQGYRPYLSSPTGEHDRAANGEAGRSDSDVSMGTTRAQDTPGSERPRSIQPPRDLTMSTTSGSSKRAQDTPGSDRHRNNTQQPTPTSTSADSDGAKTNANANTDDPAEPPAKKRRRNKASNANDIPDGAEVEYEDADGSVGDGARGDWTRGRMFVHPPQGDVQACIRCHRIKRKCDGAWPRCASCARVDVACVFELSAATSSYVHKLKKTNEDLAADLRTSEARIHDLETRIHTLEMQLGAAIAAPSANAPPYPPLGYAAAPYGPYAVYAANYPGPYGEYGEGFNESWAEHWRPEGEGWWGHV